VIGLKAPDQDLFDSMYKLSKSLGIETYDHRPLKDEPVNYPFVDIGDVQTVNIATKTRGLGTLHITMNTWGTPTQRKRISDIQESLFSYAQRLRELQFYNVAMNVKGSSSQIVGDTSVPNSFLWHGVMDFEFRLI
jgi:hypothetical protein